MTSEVNWRLILLDLHEAEHDLADLLFDIASRHDKDLEFHADCLRLARLSTQHVSQIAALGQEHGEKLAAMKEDSGLLSGLRDWAAGLLGGPRQVELLRVDDLRRVVLTASAIELDWQLLGKIGTLSGAGDLTSTAAECRQDTAAQIAWAIQQVMALGPALFVTEAQHRSS